MSILKKCFFCFFLFVSVSLRGEIVEIQHMQEIYDHLTPGALVIFEVDNTLIEPMQMLGSEQWFHHRIREFKVQGLGHYEAMERALPEWIAIQSFTRVKLVEKGIDELVRDLQYKGFHVMGLTKRGLGLATRTIAQLKTLDVDLSFTAPTQNDLFLSHSRGMLFRHGIFFVAGTHGGEAFHQFLKETSYEPDSVLFINNKGSYIKELEKACAEKEIPFTGLRYGYLDEKIKNFQKQIAEVQFYFFGRLLSDEAAERALID